MLTLVSTQAAIHARSQQQNRSIGAPTHGVPSVGGHVPGGMPPITNGTGSGSPYAMSNGSPTRASPVTQQSMSSQMAQGNQHSSTVPASFPNAGVDPRATMGGLTPQQQAHLAGINPQQRQLLLIQQQQQQQMMRSGNGALVNPQMLQQQRMPSTSSFQNPSMMGNMMENSIPALRSNPGVPGIARSARTPSDHVSSPMTPRLSGQIPDEMQRAMMQQRGSVPPPQDSALPQMTQSGMQNNPWSQSSPPSLAGLGNYGVNTMPPNPASFGALPGASTASQTWSQNGGTGSQFPFNLGSPSVGPQSSDGLPGSRHASATPAPSMGQNSPVMDQTGLSEMDIFNWTQ